jgi:hypothetical protein
VLRERQPEGWVADVGGQDFRLITEPASYGRGDGPGKLGWETGISRRQFNLEPATTDNELPKIKITDFSAFGSIVRTANFPEPPSGAAGLDAQRLQAKG